jgi:UDP-N-acetylmuramoyl-L-alanine---L-glutamate ligase
MRISELAAREVGLLGFGREGRAMHDALRRAGHDRTVHVLADRPIPVPEGVRLHAGEEGFRALAQLDVLVRSPGFAPGHPLRRAADAAGLVQTTGTNVFLAEVRASGLPVVGITGSKGKSTTSTVAYLTLKEAGVACVLAGNVGVAAIDLVDQVRGERLVTVLELSSYQCADLVEGVAPSVACLLDLFPEHMDWHGGVGPYYAAKARIGLAQRGTDRLRYNAGALTALPGEVRDAITSRRPPSAEPINSPGGLHFAGGWFSRGTDRLCSDARMALPGVHNRENAVAAFAVAELLGARPEHLEAVLASFRGLPFRMEDEGEHAGIRWINDSLSTAPEVVAVGLRAAGAGVRTVIVGGHDRGYDHAPLIEELAASSVRTLIALPDTGPAIARLVRAARLDLRVREVSSLDHAVALAVEHTPSGSACLFSPGAPSYNAYESFEERGRHFRTLVRGLARAGRV